jgi:hypothetical protein
MTPVKTGRKAKKPDFLKPQKRQEIVKQLFDQLDEWEKDQAPAYIAELMARHDKYHGRNPLLIAMQDPDSTDVDSYNAWLERGRRPMGSGYGIRIVRPIGRWEEKDPNDPTKTIEHVRGYDYFPVFDVRHTIEDPDEMVNHKPTAAMLAWRAAHPDGKW